MEAGGIEPPSRDGFRDASTCVVGCLFLGSVSASRQALASPSPTVFLPRRGQASLRSQPTGVVVWTSGRHPHDGLRVLRSHGK